MLGGLPGWGCWPCRFHLLSTLECEQHQIVLLFPGGSRKSIQFRQDALDKGGSIRRVATGDRREAVDSKHLPIGVVCLDQTIAVEEYGLPESQRGFLFLIDAVRHQPERHAAG